VNLQHPPGRALEPELATLAEIVVRWHEPVKPARPSLEVEAIHRSDRWFAHADQVTRELRKLGKASGRSRRIAARALHW
jgi:hypothetical protein